MPVVMPKVAEIVRQARALVFDFDGTLVDSNSIKWRAFELCFGEFPDRLEEILAYCRGHHHTPRGEKFRYVYERILGLPFTSEVEAALQGRFAGETTRQIIEAPEIPGATCFLRTATRRQITAALSSTPHETLLHILGERGWREYFGVIQGAPVHKAAWLQAFRERRGLQGNDVVFFGDTPEDASAARAAGWTFIAVVKDKPPGDVTHSIPDFVGLLAL